MSEWLEKENQGPTTGWGSTPISVVVAFQPLGGAPAETATQVAVSAAGNYGFGSPA